MLLNYHLKNKLHSKIQHLLYKIITHTSQVNSFKNSVEILKYYTNRTNKSTKSYI